MYYLLNNFFKRFLSKLTKRNKLSFKSNRTNKNGCFFKALLRNITVLLMFSSVILYIQWANCVNCSCHSSNIYLDNNSVVISSGIEWDIFIRKFLNRKSIKRCSKFKNKFLGLKYLKISQNCLIKNNKIIDFSEVFHERVKITQHQWGFLNDN